MKESTEICNLIKLHKAHIYVCGDVQMAENVYQTLRWAYSREGSGEKSCERKISYAGK